MTSEWPSYKTKNGDTLDAVFFNNRLRSIDNRLLAIEDTLGTIEEGNSSLVSEAIEAVQSASAQALINFNNSLAETLSVVTAAQQDIEDLQAEVTALLGTLGSSFQVDCNAGSKVQIRRTATPASVPAYTALDYGELYVNYADKKLYYRATDNTVVELTPQLSAAALLTLIKTVDGNGSGLDADLFRGNAPSAFALATHSHPEYMPASGGTINGVTAVTVNSVNPALKVTQTGTGDAFQVDHDGVGTDMFRVAADGVTYCKSLIVTDTAALRTLLGVAPTANPTFTGTVTVPTAAVDDSTTKAASTAYVQGELADRVITARTVTGAGLASGGGDLSANRVITVTKSSNAQAIAGTDDTTAMTPIRTKEAVDTFAPLLNTLKWLGRSLTVSTSAPSGGVDNDIWFERQA